MTIRNGQVLGHKNLKLCPDTTPYTLYLLLSQFFLSPRRNNDLDFETPVLKEANKKTHHKWDLLCACLANKSGLVFLKYLKWFLKIMWFRTEGQYLCYISVLFIYFEIWYFVPYFSPLTIKWFSLDWMHFVGNLISLKWYISFFFSLKRKKLTHNCSLNALWWMKKIPTLDN